MAFPINFDDVSQHNDDDDNDGLHFDDSRNRPRSSQANRRANAGRRNAVVTVNGSSNDDNDNNNDNDNDDDEAIWAVCWESLDTDPAIVLLCEGCDDEVHLHMVVWRRCPTAIGSAKCASLRLLRKRPLESWLLQNKFTTLVLDARWK